MRNTSSMFTRITFSLMLVGCETSDDPTAGAGPHNIGGASMFEDVNPTCVHFTRLSAACYGWSVYEERQSIEGCRSHEGTCLPEAEAHWTCAVEGLEKSCSYGCTQLAAEWDICRLTAATCESQENSCRCTGEYFKPGNSIVTCAWVEADPVGGAGGGGSGGAPQVVQCTCGSSEGLWKICQQEALDCSLETSCCTLLQ